MSVIRCLFLATLMLISPLACYGGGLLQNDFVSYLITCFAILFFFIAVPIIVYRLLRHRVAITLRILIAIASALLVFPGVCFFTEGHWFSYRHYGYIYDPINEHYFYAQRPYSLRRVGLDFLGWGCDLYFYQKLGDKGNPQIGHINLQHGFDERVVHAHLSGPASATRLRLTRYSTLATGPEQQEVIFDTILNFNNHFDFILDCNK